MYSSRRPVPSNAALRTLRQLAYISSGTVCAAAALVAEERRRQTCLAKKVVDNAKRIRQHPRYAHAAAAAVQPSDNLYFQGDVHDHGQSWQNANRHSDHNNGEQPTRQEHQISEQSVNPRSQYLPSEVDKGYRKLIAHGSVTSSGISNKDGDEEQEGCRVRQHTSYTHPRQKSTNDRNERRNNVDIRSKAVRPLVETQESSRSEASGTKSNRTKKLGSDKRKEKPISPLSDGKSASQTQRDTYAERRIAKPRRPNSESSKVQTIHAPHGERSRTLKDDFIRRIASDVAASQYDMAIRRMAMLKATSEDDLAHSLSKHRSAKISKDCIDPISRHTVDDAVEAFNATYAPPEKQVPSKPWLARLANELLQRALSVSSRTSVENVCCWLDAHRGFTLDHMQLLTSKGEFLLNVDDGESSGIQHSSSDAPSTESAILAVIFGFLCRKRELNKHHSRLFLEFIEHNHNLDIGQTMSSVCLEVAAVGSITSATHLFVRFAPHMRSDIVLVKLARTLHQHAASTGDIASCIPLLNFLESSGEPFSDELEVLLQECRKQGEDKKASHISQHYISHQGMSSGAYTQLFLGLSKHHSSTIAAAILPHLPRSLDMAMLAKSRDSWSQILMRQWYETANFQLVVGTFDSMRGATRSAGVPPTIYNTMIRIAVMAGKDDTARDLIHKMQREDGLRPDVSTYISWAYTRARSQDWEEVQRLLGLVTVDMLSSIGQYARAHLFTPLIREFSNQHDSESLWEFVTDLFRRLQIDMHRATFSVVFKALVRDSKPDKIGAWLIHIQDKGLRIEITNSDVADAFSEFYRAQKPSSTLVSHIVRRLSYEARHLVSRDLLLLNLDAVTRDMRRNRGIGTDIQKHTAYVEEQTFLKERIARMNIEELANNVRDVKRPPVDVEQTSSVASTVQEKSKVTQLHDVLGTTHNRRLKEKLEDLHGQRAVLKSEMLLSMSLGRTEEVVKFYRDSLSSRGLPMSSISLDVAVEASLARHNGDHIEAMELIDKAQDAGLNVTSCLTPLMVSQFKSMSRDEAQNLANVKVLVSRLNDFYRTMAKNQIPVSHHVAVTAASTMIKFGYPEKAVQLLRTIFHSSRAHRNTFEVTTYTVLLKAYTAIRSKRGAEWVLKQVLTRDIIIDHKFLLEIKHSMRSLQQRQVSSHHRRRVNALVDSLAHWHEACKSQKYAQQRATRILGNHLVDALVTCSRASRTESTSSTPLIREVHGFATKQKSESTRYHLMMSKRAFHSRRQQRFTRARVRRTRWVQRIVRDRKGSAADLSILNGSSPIPP